VAKLDHTVELEALLRETVAGCGDKLAQRGVRLAVAAEGPIPPVRGNSQRLRLVLEHLLNNAAQAVRQARMAQAENGRSMEDDRGPLTLVRDDDEEPPTIRVTVSRSDDAIHLVVSDNGPGFRDPTRVFDPFYTTRQPGEGAGLGLSICYGIVREHGGEISAFNLRPHGAAVVIELPIHKVIAAERQAALVSEPQGIETEA
jgi:signal transduction histidine kinase